MKVKGFTWIFTLLFFALLSFGQKEQKSLENKRQKLMKDIQRINRVLDKQRQKKTSTLTKIEETGRKINITEKLISITNQEINLLGIQILNNEEIIKRYGEEVKALKKDYARMVRQSYKSRSEQSRLMFILSSKSFYQAYKRILYIKQYANYRKQQGLAIIEKKKETELLNEILRVQLEKQKNLEKENRQSQRQLSQQKQKQKQIIRAIKLSESKYKSQIREKQQQATRIDREIERLIKSTIAKSNKGSTNKKAKTFARTPETRKNSQKFYLNKGKMIWPIERGTKVRGFGQYSDPVYPNIKYYNNGITIATSVNAEARAVFGGEISAILMVPGGKKAVQIRHGEYITTYYNLTQVFVQKDEKVQEKQSLGEIFTDSEGKTELKFFIYKNTKRLNPEEWIYKI